MGVRIKTIFLGLLVILAIGFITLQFFGWYHSRANLGGPSSYPPTAKVDVISLTGVDADNNHQIEAIEAVIGAGRQATSMNLYSLIIVMKHTVPNEILWYNKVGNKEKKYFVEINTKGKNYRRDYLSSGDVLKLKFNLTSPLYENQSGKMIVRMLYGGTPTEISFTTPETINKKESEINVIMVLGEL